MSFSAFPGPHYRLLCCGAAKQSIFNICSIQKKTYPSLHFLSQGVCLMASQHRYLQVTEAKLQTFFRFVIHIPLHRCSNTTPQKDGCIYFTSQVGFVKLGRNDRNEQTMSNANMRSTKTNTIIDHKCRN